VVEGGGRARGEPVCDCGNGTTGSLAKRKSLRQKAQRDIGKRQAPVWGEGENRAQDDLKARGTVVRKKKIAQKTDKIKEGI